MNANFPNCFARCLVLTLLLADVPLHAQGPAAWHWRNPLPQGDELRGVAQGNGTFVAVGERGIVFTSPDGVVWARLLGNKEAAGLLQEILAEEKAANHALSELARSRSNNEALGECAVTEFCGGGKDAKSLSLNGRRGVRPLGKGSSRLAPMAP